MKKGLSSKQWQPNKDIHSHFFTGELTVIKKLFCQHGHFDTNNNNQDERRFRRRRRESLQERKPRPFRSPEKDMMWGVLTVMSHDIYDF